MTHQVNSVRVDVEFLANKSEDVHHIELAELTHVLWIIGRSEADGPRPASGGSCPPSIGSRPATGDWRPANAVSSVIVVPHWRDDDVSARFREFGEVSKANLVARLDAQT